MGSVHECVAREVAGSSAGGVARAVRGFPSSSSGGSQLILDRRLRRRERVRRRSDFDRAYRRGEHSRGQYVRLHWIANELPYCRLGITVGRRVGGAIARNRLKRRVREIFRNHKESFPKGRDVIVHLLAGADGLEYVEMEQQILELIKGR